MPDNVTVDNGGLTDYVVATDDDGTAQPPYTKIEFGPDNTQTKVTATVGLPVNPVQETANVGIGAVADAEATGNGSVIGILKRLRTLLAGGLPAALGANGGVKVDVVGTTIPAVVTLEAAYTTAQTDTAIVSATAPDKVVVTSILVVVDNANTVDVGYRIGFGATATPTTTGVVSSHPGLAAGTGVQRGDGSGVLGVGAAGEDLRITSEVPTGGSLRVVVSYYLTT